MSWTTPPRWPPLPSFSEFLTSFSWSSSRLDLSLAQSEEHINLNVARHFSFPTEDVIFSWLHDTHRFFCRLFNARSPKKSNAIQMYKYIIECAFTLMKCLARVKRPRVVWRADSGPRGTKSFNFSRHVRSWARLEHGTSNFLKKILSLAALIFNRQCEKSNSFLFFCCPLFV